MADLNITPGESVVWQIVVTTPAGVAQNIAGVSEAWFTVKARIGESDPGFAQLTLTNSTVTRSDNAAGKFNIVMPSATSNGMQDGRTYFWDFRCRWSNGAVSNPVGLSGKLVALNRITHATGA